jgi:PAS domain-containing protein/two-component sensor histidine kinase
MTPARDPLGRKSDWDAWSNGARNPEIVRLETELAESRVHERKYREEAVASRERFERLLDVSRRFTRTLSDRSRHYQASRRYLAAQHAIDALLAEADGLTEAAAEILKTLGENLGWQAAALWVVRGETLRCVEVWHRPNAAPDGFAEGFAKACRRATFASGEDLPGSAWAKNKPVWDGGCSQEVVVDGLGEPVDGMRGALAFPILAGSDSYGVIELWGGEDSHPNQELLYTVGLIGRRLGQFAERRKAMAELRETEERLRLATEAGHVGLYDWHVLAGEGRYSGAMVEIYDHPPGGFDPTYEGFLARVHPDDRPRVRRTLDASVAAGTPHELECRIVRSSGEVRWVQVKGRVYTNGNGESARALGVTLDVTEQKWAEREREHIHALEAGAQAEEAERQRISRELHDRVAHSMGVAHQNLQLYEALAEKDPARARSKLQTAKEMTKTALEQTRNLSMELRRSETENGLVPALQDLLEVAVPEEVSVDLSTSGAESRLSDNQRGQLYVILREAVHNAVRHSDCRHLKVGLDVTQEEVSGYVEDEGRGFADNNGEGKVGLGLRSIKERVTLLHGTSRVYSSPEGGAGVWVSLPLGNGGGG